LGIGVSTLVLVALTGGVAALMERGVLGLEWMNYAAAAILLLSAFLGAGFALGGRGGWADAASAEAGFLLVLLILNALLFEGALSGFWVTVLMTAGGGTGAVLLLNRPRKTGRTRYRKRVHR
jgi:hypothetical protein